ncbi:hypothetical protein [Devosia sp. 2618]|uniref:hypothetical protein n=1 Tax=Devosia sp. 2618 TaxID=3156454 RepID=UPI00339AC7DB
MSKPLTKRVDLGFAEVDNPHASYAQTLHDEQSGVERPGKIIVPVNLRTQLGGFAKFAGTELQNETVRRFKTIFEGAQIGGARACDPSVEPVDGGGVRQDGSQIFGADARQAYSAVSTLLGKDDTKRLEMVAIGEKGPTQYAAWRTGNAKPNARLVAKHKHELRIIVLRLAHHWKMAATVDGRRESAAWSDGTTARTPSALDQVA